MSKTRIVAFTMLGLSLVLFVYRETHVPTLTSEAIVVRALACTCPDYKVLGGEQNLRSPILDTVKHLNKAEIYVSGMNNPWDANYETMFDDYRITGKVVGLDRVSEGDPWNPVVEVASWEPIGEVFYTLSKWVIIGGSLLSAALFFWSGKA